MTQVHSMTPEQEIAFLRQQIATMKADKQRKLGCKVSEKGGISVYGMGRFPVTLYRSQWEALIEYVKSGAIDRFIEANADLLSTKADKA